MSTQTSEIFKTTVFAQDKPLKHLNRIASRPPLNLEFQDLSFSVKATKGDREILHSINGKFKSGELSAIMGPSGAGKSTLLNILAGFITIGVKGNVTVNGRSRNRFEKISSYIMQENITQPFLTVREAMVYAANFKLGDHFENKDKILVVEEVINFLGLENCADSFTSKLSGGQCRRLTIALELLCNTPIIFLDEPTTGLDDFTTKQCIDLLRKITRLGRTVICTIHQPQASLFQIFDQVYIVANGYCVYNGSPSNLVPFLSANGYSCPSTYTPADYVIELIHSDQSTVFTLKEAVQNGKFNIKPVPEKEEDVSDQLNDIVLKSSFLVQFSTILSRMYVQTRRNTTALSIQFLHHLLTGALIGSAWTGRGNDAKFTFTMYLLVLACIMTLVYTYMMVPILSFPFHLELMKREIFNKWYSLTAYYLALTVSTLPLLIVLSTLFLTVIYFITDQPKELDRYLGFCLVGIFISYTSQSLVYMIGSSFSVSSGSIMGPTIYFPATVIANYGIGFSFFGLDTFWTFMRDSSFIRHGAVGMTNAIFYGREKLICAEEEMFCLTSHPSTLLKFLSIVGDSYRSSLLNLGIFILVFRVATYFCLQCRVDSEFFAKILYKFKRKLHLL